MRTKEEIIKDIEIATNTKLNRENNDYLISIGQYRFYENDKLRLNIFKDYKVEPFVLTAYSNMSYTLMKLITELMEVLENERNKNPH